MVLSEAQRRQLKDEGFCIVPNVLAPGELIRVQQALDRAIEQTRQAGSNTYDVRLDPNAANVRVYNLPERDPVFIELLRNPAALACVEAVLGPNFIVSNFSANIAHPGSAPMRTHSDQALSVPEPWHAPWVLNIIWCLDDVDAENGATRYLPGSHRFRSFSEVPSDTEAQMQSFVAKAGSFVAMDGRLWHSSGSNTSVDRQRRMAFGYYGLDFIRPQVNWEATLSETTKASLDEEGRRLFGLGVAGNTRIGGALTRL
jgi:ectoine hydroxylase-related dioxygenase (phytanoyl-CoA dioxygenase family)